MESDQGWHMSYWLLHKLSHFVTQEYQSFTDLQFSKDKTVTCIDWHPSIKGVVAVSVGEKLSFDERIDYAHRVIMTPSLILIWSFTDPIHPQVGPILGNV